VGLGIAVAIGGLIQVAMAQVSVAILVIVDNSREALALQRAIAKDAGISQTVTPTPVSAMPVTDEVAEKRFQERENVTI